MSSRRTTEKEQKSNRPKRKPIRSASILRAENRSGYIRRYVNDVHNRIQRFLEAGYTPVVGEDTLNDYRAQDGSKLGSIVRKPVGGGINAVLMEIPEEFYHEDQALKQVEVDKFDEAIGTKKERDGIFEDIKISRG